MQHYGDYSLNTYISKEAKRGFRRGFIPLVLITTGKRSVVDRRERPRLNMYANIEDMRQLHASLKPIKMKGQGKIGDFPDLEKLNGNDDTLAKYDGQLSGYGYDIIDINDEGTFGAFLTARCIGVNEDYHLVGFECECGTPDVRVDSYRSEVYCDICGLVNDFQPQVASNAAMNHDDLMEDWRYHGDRHIYRDEDDGEHYTPSTGYENWTGKELPSPPVVKSKPYIEIHVVVSGTITFTCPITAKMVTKETYKRVGAETPWTEEITIAKNPIHRLEVSKRKAVMELQKHEQKCEKFCYECERLDKRVTGIGRKLHAMMIQVGQ